MFKCTSLRLDTYGIAISAKALLLTNKSCTQVLRNFKLSLSPTLTSCFKHPSLNFNDIMLTST
jgi:hypothetical protein